MNWCFTCDQETATAWDKCVRDTAVKEVKNAMDKAEMEGNVSADVIYGRCEWIENTSSSSGNRAAGLKWGDVKMIVGLGMIGLLVVAGGLL